MEYGNSKKLPHPENQGVRSVGRAGRRNPYKAKLKNNIYGKKQKDYNRVGMLGAGIYRAF